MDHIDGKGRCDFFFGDVEIDHEFWSQDVAMKPKAGENGEQKSSAFFGHMVSVASGNFSMQESAMVTMS